MEAKPPQLFTGRRLGISAGHLMDKGNSRLEQPKNSAGARQDKALEEKH